MRFHCSSVIASTLLLAGASAVLVGAPQAFGQERGGTKQEKPAADDGSIAAGAILSDCDGVLLSPPDRQPSDHLGTAVAVRGDTLIAGAPGCNTPNVLDVGALYFYHRINGVWTEGQKIIGALPGDSLGSSVAMLGDYAVSGARYSDDLAVDAGVVHPLHRTSATNWWPDLAVSAWDGAAGDEFGAAVAMGQDWIAASSPYKQLGNQPIAGKVYLYRRNGMNWVWNYDLTFPTPQAGDALGTSLAMVENVVAAGAAGRTSNGHSDAGAVVVAEALVSQVPFSAFWTREIVTANDAQPNDHFGEAVALTPSFMYVGAPDADAPGYPDAGAVYVFHHWGTASYNQVAKIVLPVGYVSAGLRFGRSISADGDNIVITDGAGNVYRYQQPSTAQSYVPVFNSRRAKPAGASTGYGRALAISGGDVAVGDSARAFTPAGGEGAVHMLPRAANDNCAFVQIGLHAVYSGCTLSATIDGSATCTGANPAPDVWYGLQGTVGNAGPWLLSINSNYDSALSVHSGACGNMQQLMCDDDSAGNFDAKLSLNVQAGQFYYVRVSGYNGSAGAYQLAMRRHNCPADVVPAPLGNRVVDVNDLLTVIGQWGTCVNIYNCPGNITGNDNVVDVNDLLSVIGSWGACPN